MTNERTALTPKVVLRALGASAFAGFAGGWVMPYINFPWVGCLICYLLGLVAGRWLTQFLDFRMAENVGKIVGFGTLLGMAFSPTGLAMLYGIAGFITSGFSPGFASIAGINLAIFTLFNPLCFFAGLLRPTVWGEY